MTIYLPAIALAVSTTLYLQEKKKYQAIAKKNGYGPSVGGPAHMRSLIATAAICIGIFASFVVSLIVRYKTGNADLAGYILAVGVGMSYTTTMTILLKKYI